MDNQDFRVTYVAPRYHTNQVPVMRGWRNAGVEVQFLAQYQGVGEVHDGVNFYQMNPSLLTKVWHRIIEKKYDPVTAEYEKVKAFFPPFFEVRRQLKEFAPDLVIIREHTKGNSVISLACRSLKIQKVIMYVQTPLYGSPEPKKRLRTLFRRIVFPPVVFTPVYYKGPAGKNGNIGKGPDMPRWFIPLVAEDPKDVKKDFCNDGIVRILDVGKYREYKNHFFLVDAVANLPNPKKFHFTILGQLSNEKENEYYVRLKQYVEEKGLAPYFDIKGEVSFSEMDKIYMEHDVLVLPSTNETAGMVILEAMAKGLCIMCSNQCGLASYLEKYGCGMVFGLENTQELTEYLQAAANDVNLISKFGERAHEVAVREFEFKNYVAHLNQLTETEFGFTIPLPGTVNSVR